MKVFTLLTVTLALSLVACGKQESTAPEQPTQDQAAAPATDVAVKSPRFDQAFIDHMHAHAEQLDELMFALADEDLDGALTPAYWLSRHEAVAGVPDEWQQYIVGMRDAARKVEEAKDLDTARAAAEKISGQCQACHVAAGVSGPNGLN